jgi:hypothetical protein
VSLARYALRAFASIVAQWTAAVRAALLRLEAAICFPSGQTRRAWVGPGWEGQGWSAGMGLAEVT